jgi:hypothetical protein
VAHNVTWRHIRREKDGVSVSIGGKYPPSGSVLVPVVPRFLRRREFAYQSHLPALRCGCLFHCPQDTKPARRVNQTVYLSRHYYVPQYVKHHFTQAGIVKNEPFTIHHAIKKV